MDGILNIYKEKGYTSHDVVAVVRKLAGQKKVGHTGTLDPDAVGVLPVCLGKATKLADYIMAEQKTYVAEMVLGITTTTQDASGEVTAVKEVNVTEDALEDACQHFRGEYDQLPPMYSAIKVKGKKLYELAREGKEVERKPRRIQIFALRIRSFAPPDHAILEIVCSKGTYIRTLVADIGERLGCGAHMSALTRTQSGRFFIENAILLADAKKLAETGALEKALLPMEEALSAYPKVWVQEKAEKRLYNGCKIWETEFLKMEGDIRVGQAALGLTAEGALVGLYTIDRDGKLFLRPQRLL